VTTVVMAATHPHGRVIGIDALPEHIDHGRRLAAEAGVENATFHAADFSADDLDLPQFDYIVAHGVYSWVDAESQAGLRRFIDRHLLRGGLVYLSYNAMPGWAADLPFQRLLVALGQSIPGDSATRFSAGAKLVHTLAAAGATSLAASGIASQLEEVEANHPIAYLAHEYMGTNWQPLFVTEVREAMAAIGLEPAGSATLIENFDSFALRRHEREALGLFEDPTLRELARDFLMHQRFRRDVYSRDGCLLDDNERLDRLLAMRYALVRPAEKVEYDTRATGAGRLAFDNTIARGIVAALAGGPQRLLDMAPAGISMQDLLANLIVLCCAGAVRPVEPRDASVAALNQVIWRRVDGPEEIDHIALPCGTAIRAEPALLRALRDGNHITDPTLSCWLNLFAVYAH
jgi:hypothetical protein